jgi:hypothetical protein
MSRARTLVSRLGAPVLRRRAISQARTLLLPDRAVILDVETTDLHGRVVELAVIDTTGRVLINTLVDPGCPIHPAAVAVHGITDGDVRGAPTWDVVLPQLVDITVGRRIVAYNAAYDKAVVSDGADPHLRAWANRLDRGQWWCAMRARAHAERGGWRRLEGGHRALGDVQATLEVLRAIAGAEPLAPQAA